MKLLLPLLALALPLAAAEPDWATLEPYALSLLQRYIQIPSINPPADTKTAAQVHKRELEAVAITDNHNYTGQGNLIKLVP
ncbi:MAG: hypothetical protein ACK6D7_19995, partial [Acidobacteriota bacterium]